MTSFELILLALFAWRVAYMLVKEEGPFQVFARLRALTTLGGLLTCIYCTSVWSALLGYLLISTPLAPVVYVLAVSGLALMAHRYTGGDFN